MNKTEEVLMEMLTENTGIAMCDSGGKRGESMAEKSRKRLYGRTCFYCRVLEIPRWLF